MSSKHNLVKSFTIAFRGLIRGLLQERNSRIQLVISVLVVSGSLILGVRKLELLVIVVACFFVIILEMINTSIEKVLDFLYPDKHEQVGLIKDIMSGVVLLGSILAVVVGVIILFEPLLRFLGL